MSVAVSRPRSRPSMIVLALALASAALLLITPAASRADQNPSNLSCIGHVGKGAPDPDDPTSGVVRYTFACSQPISGYSLVLDREATAMETEVFATDLTTKEVVATDAFSCNGDIPGLGVNCTGTYGGRWNVISGTYDVDGKVCAEPRPHPMLIATYATVNAKGQVVQYIAGPFDLGRPRKGSCPRVAKESRRKARKRARNAGTRAVRAGRR